MATKVTIVTGPALDPVERRAVSQLQRYVRLLFGFNPAVSRARVGAGTTIVMGTSASNPELSDHRRLGEQDYVLRRRSPRRLDLCGGSPAAVLWATYELIEQWGVTWLLQGDVLPPAGSAGPFALPPLDVRRRPLFETRLSRVLGDMLNSTLSASLAEHEKLLEQLSKLRFNAVLAGMNCFHPWYHWSFRGVQRSSTGLFYGCRHVVHERTIGRDAIGQLGQYTNPDLQGAATYEEQLEAGRRLLHGIVAAAHARGIRVVAAHSLTDFPAEILEQLPQWSRGHRVPRSATKQDRAFSLGTCLDGGAVRYGRWLTPLNPVLLELVETSLGAFIDEYPEMDGFFVTQAESPPGSGGIEPCWRALDRRHGLGPQFTYRKLLEEAKRTTVAGSTERAVGEAQGAILSLRLLDLVLNERPAIRERLGSHVKLYTSFIGPTAAPLLPHIFDPDRMEFLAQMDYLPAEVARRIHLLDFARNSAFKVHLQATINDDNVGFLPQLSAEVLQTTVKGMRRHGVSGYWFRLYDTSRYEHVIRYMAEAGWDRAVTPRRSWSNHVERICGPEAVKPMLKAFRLLEGTLDDVNHMMGTGFMFPPLLSKFWGELHPGRIHPDAVRTWGRLIAAYLRAEPHLEAAIAVASTPAGRQYAADHLAFVRFARLFLQTAQRIRRARLCYSAATALKPTEGGRRPFDIDGYDKLLREAAERLENAVAGFEPAVRLWAGSVRDANDRGSLVGINAYGLDWLRSMARVVRGEADCWNVAL